MNKYNGKKQGSYNCRRLVSGQGRGKVVAYLVFLTYRSNEVANDKGFLCLVSCKHHIEDIQQKEEVPFYNSDRTAPKYCSLFKVEIDCGGNEQTVRAWCSGGHKYLFRDTQNPCVASLLSITAHIDRKLSFTSSSLFHTTEQTWQNLTPTK